MESQLEGLKNLVMGKKSGFKETELTDILDMAREFGCLGEIIGRDFEIRNPKGELVYVVHQKPIAIIQVNNLLKEFVVIKNLDAKREAAKFGSKGKGRVNKRRK